MVEERDPERAVAARSHPLPLHPWTVVTRGRRVRFSLRLETLPQRGLDPRQQPGLGHLATKLIAHVERVDDPTVEGRHLREVDAEMEVRERPRDVVQEADPIGRAHLDHGRELGDVVEGADGHRARYPWPRIVPTLLPDPVFEGYRPLDGPP